MKVVIIHQGQVLEFDSPSLVLVKDGHGNPVAVASETGLPGLTVVSSVEDPSFNKVLQSLGINNTVIVQRQKILQPGQLPFIVKP